MSQHFTIPIRTEHVIVALIVVVFGLGVVVGSVLGNIGVLMGVLISALGFLYAYNQYMKQKHQAAQPGAAGT
ncbi:MAG: hypothetical protein JRN67_09085 [Nitrososphaerota archaeon]|nr:hypothetical protein [Nitrososphaerota archaeon]